MKKRGRISLDTAIVDLWKREVGGISNRNFANLLGASEDLVLRLDLSGKLDKHRGCVNTVSFNEDGDILISGSDDRRVILWDWEIGRVKISFHSGHSNNIFQAKIMPCTDDRSIVTCAADGQVRHAQILERGRVETKLLGKHQARAHKLAIEPGSPHIFYTCGEDGLVQHFDLRTGAATELFTCMSFRDIIVNLNAIAIDPRKPNLFAVAGSDEYTRLYDIRKYKWDASNNFGQPIDCFCPQHLIGDEQVGITGLAFSDKSELLVSYNDENIYLFSRCMGLGPDPADQQSGESMLDKETVAQVGPQVYKGHKNCETVKGVNFFGPKCEYVVSGSDCGRIFIWKKKDGELIRVMEADKYVVNCIESHPHTTALASSGIENDIKIWTPKAVENVKLPENIEKVLIPARIRLFSFGDGIDDDDDDDDDEDDEVDYYDFTDDSYDMTDSDAEYDDVDEDDEVKEEGGEGENEEDDDEEEDSIDDDSMDDISDDDDDEYEDIEDEEADK